MFSETVSSRFLKKKKTPTKQQKHKKPNPKLTNKQTNKKHTQPTNFHSNDNNNNKHAIIIIVIIVIIIIVIIITIIVVVVAAIVVGVVTFVIIIVVVIISIIMTFVIIYIDLITTIMVASDLFAALREVNVSPNILYKVCSFFGCLTSQQHASVSQGRIYSDNFTCCHTEIEVADQTFHLTQSQYTDTGPNNPSTDPITPGPDRVATGVPIFKSLV